MEHRAISHNFQLLSHNTAKIWPISCDERTISHDYPMISHDILILSEFFNPYDPDKTERRPVMLQKTPIGNGEYSYKVFASLRVSFRYGMDQSDQFWPFLAILAGFGVSMTLISLK